MNRQLRIVRPTDRHRNKRTWRPQVEALDARILLHASGGLDGLMAGDPGGDDLVDDHELGSFPAVEVPAAAAAATGGASSGSVALAPLTSVPVLNSLLGAPASLYLDFDGHFEPQWGSYTKITTPAFDQDGDPTTFSATELSTITQVWQSVAEDYAPFNLNVTTVEPTSFADGVALRVVIGGDGAWTGGTSGGIAYVDSFTNALANTAFVFSKNLGNGTARYTADAGAHESGHAFGLQHQSQYDAAGNLVSEYSTGPGDGRAPILGNSYGASRGLWWYGTTVSATTVQDDLAVISRAQNGFGYRPDDHGDTAAAATPLTVSGAQVSGAGVIAQTSDLDVFSFATGAGTISLTVDVPAGINDLDARLELRDATGATLIAADDSSTNFGATVTAKVAAGAYRLVVASHGSYGDVGQYTVRGTIVASTSSTIAAPTNLTATASSPTRVNLSWTDKATNETGYRVERSTDGTTWVTITTAATNATAYADTAAVAGTTYQYRVSAVNAATASDFSNVASATTVPVAPAGLTAAVVSSVQINLSWGDVAGETGFQVERSTDGVTWTVAGTTGTNVTSFQDTGLTAGTKYQYRVKATNAGGTSAASTVAAATTSSALTLPTAPSGLAATAASKTRVNLSWADKASNESGFRIERSSDSGKSWTQIAQVGANVTTYTDQTVSGQKSYSYRVRAYNTAGNSAYSTVATVTTPKASLASLAPSSWNGTAAAGPTVKLSPALMVLVPADPRPAPIVVTSPTAGSAQRSSGALLQATVVDHALEEWRPLASRARRLKQGRN